MEYTESLLQAQQGLIEELGVYFESNESMSPLSARIFALLVLAGGGDQGITFEEITEKLAASKSSVSTNLQLLQTQGRVTYFTKYGDRKRYFRMSEDHVTQRIDERIDAWKKEKRLYEKVLEFKTELLKVNQMYNPEEQGLQFGLHYIKVIQSMIDNLEELKKNLNLINN